MAIPNRIRQLANYIRTKIYGREVREAIAEGIEVAGDIADNSSRLSTETANKQDILEQKYNEQIENMSSENPNSAELVDAHVSGFDGNIYPTIGKRMDKIEEKSHDITVNAKDYGARGDGITDDSESIQSAIDYLDSQGGGKLIFSNGVFAYAQDIYIKEGTRIEVSNNSSFLCLSDNASLIFYNDVQLNTLEINFPETFNGNALLFNNAYVSYGNKRDKNRSNARIYIGKLKLYKVFNSTTTDAVAFKFYSNRQTEHTPIAGFWGVNIKDSFIEGFNLIFHLQTEQTGWINGNVFENITCENFVNIIKVEKSEDSLGLTKNIFKDFHVQTRPQTRDLIIDSTRENQYYNFYTYDMHVNVNSKLGDAVIIPNSGTEMTFPKTRYTWILNPNRYYLLGTFLGYTGLAQHVMINVNSYTNYNTDFYITGLDRIERRTHGTIRLNNSIKFFKKPINNGKVEIYLAVDESVEANVFIESIRSFIPSSFQTYTTVDGLEEITNFSDYYPNTMGMYETGSNENGTWVKYSDGTMICRQTKNSSLTPNSAVGNIFRSSQTETWTFPQSFISDSNLIVSVSASTANRWGDITAHPTVNECRFNVFSAVQSNETSVVFLSAIGRWR